MDAETYVMNIYKVCTKHFYHVNRSLIICPKCSTVQQLGKTVQSFCLNTSVTAVKSWFLNNIPDVSRGQDMGVAVPCYGYVTPILFVIILILNTLLIIALAQRRRRSPTNVILTAIAVFDILTITFPLPWYIYYFTLKHFNDFASYPWCVYYTYFATTFPTICHNCSVWLTVLLAIHRFMGVNRPKRCSCFTSYKAVCIWIGIVLTLTVILHMIYLIVNKLEPITVLSKKIIAEEDLLFISTCNSVPRVNDENFWTSIKVYLWIRTVFVQIIPLLALTVFNVFLLKTVCQGYTYRRQISIGSRVIRKSDQREVIRTSTMLVTICIFTWVVEIPQCVMLFCVYLQTLQGVQVFTADQMKMGLTVVNFILFITLPSNFAICFGLSDRFRESLKALVTRRKHSRHGIICTSGISLSTTSNGHGNSSNMHELVALKSADADDVHV